MPPDYLYKLMSPENWTQSQKQDNLVLYSIDTDFIHLATKEQIDRVAKKFWRDKDFVVLKLDPKKIIGKLVYESNPGGSQKYYHVYNGHIPTGAVVAVVE